MKRIGIYGGSFNPVHAGHIAFALQALEAAQLDAVYFVPERRPRHKQGVEHFGHRVAMLKRASKPHRRLHVLEIEDMRLSVAITLPRLQKHFSGAELVFLLGSDVAPHVPEWANAKQLLKHELVVGVRADQQAEKVPAMTANWPLAPKRLTVVQTYGAELSSTVIREAISSKRYVPGLLTSVERYAVQNWLYVSLVNRSKNNTIQA